MKKKVILRSLIGAPIGLSISFIITLIISVIINKGEYYPVVPQLTALCGNELNAVVIQTICSLIYGAAFGGTSVIWEIENWSLLKQTVIHCIVISSEADSYSLHCYLRINAADRLLYVLDAA